MKNLFLLAIAAFMFSCNNVEKFRADIDGLSTQWSEIETMVTDLSKSTTSQQANYMSAIEAITVDEKVFSKLKEADQKNFEDTKGAAMAVAGGYNAVLEQMVQFSNQWTAKKADLDALTGGLASKKLPKDVETQIAALKTYMDGTTPTIDSWKNALATLETTGNQKLDEMKALVASFPAAKK